jgi:hypothetical protein
VPTSTTLAPAELIALGSHPIDAQWCLDNWAKVRTKLRQTGYEDIPKGGPEAFSVWVSENPEDSADICGITYATHETDALLERIRGIYGSEANTSIKEGLSDTELVWCHDHGSDIVHSARILEIGPDPLVSRSLGLPDDPYVFEHSDQSSGEFWEVLHPDAFVRACNAAFGAR